MFCPMCASPAIAGQRFCRNCGAPFSAQSAQAEESKTPLSVIEHTTLRLEGVEPSWKAEAAPLQTISDPEGIISKIKHHKLGVSLALALLTMVLVISSLAFLVRRPREMNSLAVLPFVTTTDDSNIEYLS